MDILGIEVSENGQKTLDLLYAKLKKPICFDILSEEDVGFGQCNISNPTCYPIKLKASLKGKQFEVNALHEICHAYQDSIGFPSIWYKNILPKDVPLEDILCRQRIVQSMILDIGVWKYLIDEGHNVNFFVDNNYNAFTKQIQSNLSAEYFPNPLIFASRLLYCLCLVNAAKVDALKLKVNQCFKNEYDQTFKLAKNLKRNGFKTPEQAFGNFVQCFNTYLMWDYMDIFYNDQIFHTQQDITNMP